MKILFTGASSFTGYWFVTKLAEAGHELHATFTRANANEYSNEIRGQRVQHVIHRCSPVFNCRFGDEQFLSVMRQEKFDLLCHHAADVTNYKSAEFDVCAAVSNNARRAIDVLKALRDARTGAALLLTGSMFEPGEGVGSEGLPAFSPYGLSKALTAQIFAYYARTVGITLGKFVIPNPFGPWEDPRFTTYLMRTWANGDVATVRTPAYVRDNMHVSLLAAAYVRFTERLINNTGFVRTNPSGYIETQGAFTERVARELRPRTGWECKVDFLEQREFEEPRERFNTEPPSEITDWSESAAWDEMASWYVHRLRGGR